MKDTRDQGHACKFRLVGSASINGNICYCYGPGRIFSDLIAKT